MPTDKELAIEAACKELEYRDGEVWWTVKRGPRKMGKPVGAKKKDGYLHMSYTGPAGKKYWFSVHQIVWWMHNKELVAMIDHVDRNPQNNRIENLRIACHKRNGQNRGKQVNNTTGFKGVTLHKGKYYAAQYGSKWLGCFKTPEEAHKAYCEYSMKLSAEFHNAG